MNNNNYSEYLAKCYVGTSGYNYKDWEIIFYPEKTKGKFDKLRFYSQFFDFVEIESTFHNFYSKDVAKSLIEKVKDNKNFTFSIILNYAFTHQESYNKNELRMMINFIDELYCNNKLECILLHLPYYFFNTKENREKLLKLKKIFKDYRLIVELKHISWHSPLTYNFLEESKFHMCLIDQPIIMGNANLKSIVLGKYSYLHLYGKGTKINTENNNGDKFDYLYSNTELFEISKIIDELRKKSDKVFIIFKNSSMGKAIANAFTLSSYIKKRPVLIPEQTVYYYSHLKPISYRVNTNQLPIFS
jgi:uncharacterized protein YecE (DUF72 family)